MSLSFERLELENYRYYYGHNELVFSTTQNKNIIVVKGDNGAGKSNLLNALTWCLYNDEMHTDKMSVGLPIMNTDYISELADSDREGETYVKLTIKVNNDLWEITRTLRGFGKKSPKWTEDKPKFDFKVSFTNLLLVYPDKTGDYIKEVDNVAQQRINELLPYDLRSFFFIDGEKLREFFKDESALKMQDAIERISQLDLLDNALNSMKEYKKDLRKELQKTSPAMDGIQRELVKVETEIENRNFQSGTIKDQNKELEIERSQINSYLDKYNVPGIRAINAEIQRLESSKKMEENKLKSFIISKNEFLVENAPRILLCQTIVDSKNIISKLIEKGDLPPKIKSSFIDELIEKGVCVCGHKIGDEERKKLEEYGERVQISELTNVAYEGKSEFEKHLDSIREFPSKLDEFNSQIDTCEYNIDSYGRSIMDKKDELSNFNIEEIDTKVKRRDEISAKIGQNHLLLKSIDVAIAKLIDSKKDLIKKQDREKEKEKVHTNLFEKLNLTESTITVLEKVEERVKEKIRLSLEKNTRDNFLDFLREEGIFTDVQINENYEVSVINTSGWNAKNDLSAGQYLVLGYAFVVALRDITGYQAPVIVDSPFGKLDQIHQDKITSKLPKLLSKSQLLFLVTSSEYNTVVKNNLTKYMTNSSYYEIDKLPNKVSARLRNAN